MPNNELKFETLKRIIKETAVPILVNRAIRDGTMTLMNLDDMLRGTYRQNEGFQKAGRGLSAFIDSVDVRQYQVLLEMCPKGTDSRIPSWVYESSGIYVGYGEDGDWVLAR